MRKHISEVIILGGGDIAQTRKASPIILCTFIVLCDITEDDTNNNADTNRINVADPHYMSPCIQIHA